MLLILGKLFGEGREGKGDIKFGDLSYPSLLMAGWWWRSALGTEREGRNKRGGKEWREGEERWRSERMKEDEE